MEFQVTKNIDKTGAKADEALQQIENKKYKTEPRNDGYKQISCHGIAFCGKECTVHCRPSASANRSCPFIECR